MSDYSPLLLGVDLGTTNGKVACYDLNGNVLSEVSQPIKTYFPEPGIYEQYPEEWVATLEELIIKTVKNLGVKAKNICGISLSNWGPGVVLMGGGKPLAPTPTWQDNRCWEYGQNLIDNLGPDCIGFGIPQSGFYARILWSLENKADLINQIEYIFDVKGFLTYWFTGVANTDPSSGPGASEWNKSIIEHIGWSVDKLPQVKKSTEIIGWIRKDLAINLGLPDKTPILAGLNDGAAATLGSGVFELGNNIISLATNGVVRCVIQNRPDSNLLIQHSLFSWPFINDLWICGGQTLCGAGSLQWFANITGSNNDKTTIKYLINEASMSPIGSKGIFFLPYLSGRGSPNTDLSFHGSFHNLRLEHKREDLIRAVLEGVSYALLEIIDNFTVLGFQINSVNLTGGGARSIFWQQILADMLEKQVINSGGDSTLGCALVSAVGLGFYPDFSTAKQKMVHEKSRSYPIQTNFDRYKQLRMNFTLLRDSISKLPVTL